MRDTPMINSTNRGRLAVILIIGAAVAVGLGVYGRLHDPTGRSLITLFFTKAIILKAWFATAAAAFAVLQVLGALRMWGKLGKGTGPSWIGKAHRFSGTTAFLLVIPVAYHCLWALGFDSSQPRTLVHSLAGCFFFGAFAAKVLAVRSKRLPSWTLPVIGGTVFTALMTVWLTSALWFFSNNGWGI